MFTNKRRRLVGILLAIAVPAVVGAIAMPADALSVGDPVGCASSPNLVANCGFEAPSSGSVPGWTHIVSHDGFVGTTQARTGTHSLTFGSTGGDDVYTQTVKVKPHTQYIVSAWIDALSNGGSANNDFGLAATNINGTSDAYSLYSNTNIGTGWRSIGQLVTTNNTTTMTLVIRGANVPDHTYVDDVRVIQQRSGCAAIANDLVGNCGFEASSVSPWVQDTNIDTGTTNASSDGGSQSLFFASTGADDSWHQVLTVRPHTTYQLSYAVEYWNQVSSTPNNDLAVTVSNVPAGTGGKLRIATTNVANAFWTTVTKTFTTGSGSTATLTITGANVPASTYVDDVSVTAVPHVRITAKGRATTTTLTGLGGQKVMLEKLVNKHWSVVHTWTAPKTGWSKSWSFTVGSGGTYRSVSGSAPGYSSAASSSIAIK